MIEHLIQQIYFLLADLENHGKFLAHTVDGFHELLAAIEQEHASKAGCDEGKFEMREIDF